MTKNDSIEKINEGLRLTSEEEVLLKNINLFTDGSVEREVFQDVSWSQWHQLYRKSQRISQDALLISDEEEGRDEKLKQALINEKKIFRAWALATDQHQWRSHNLHGRTDLANIAETQKNKLKKQADEIEAEIQKEKENPEKDQDKTKIGDLQTRLMKRQQDISEGIKELEKSKAELDHQSEDVTLEEWLNACAWRGIAVTDKQRDPDFPDDDPQLEKQLDGLGQERRFLQNAITKPGALNLSPSDHLALVASRMYGHEDFQGHDGFKISIDVYGEQLAGDLTYPFGVLDKHLKRFYVVQDEYQKDLTNVSSQKRIEHHRELMVERSKAKSEQMQLAQVDVSQLTPAEQSQHEYRKGYLTYLDDGFDIRHEAFSHDDIASLDLEKWGQQALARASSLDELFNKMESAKQEAVNWSSAIELGLNIFKELEVKKFSDERKWRNYKRQLQKISENQEGFEEGEFNKVEQKIEFHERELKQNRDEIRKVIVKLDRIYHLSSSINSPMHSSSPKDRELLERELRYIETELHIQHIDVELKNFQVLRTSIVVGNKPDQGGLDEVSANMERLTKTRTTLIKEQLAAYSSYRKLMARAVDKLEAAEQSATDPVQAENISRELTIAWAQRNFRRAYHVSLDEHLDYPAEFSQDYYQACQTVARLKVIEGRPDFNESKSLQLEKTVLTSELKLIKMKHQLIYGQRELSVVIRRSAIPCKDAKEVEARIQLLDNRKGTPNERSTDGVELPQRQKELRLREEEAKERAYYDEKKQLFAWVVRSNELPQLIAEIGSEDVNSKLIAEQGLLAPLIESATEVTDINDRRREEAQKEQGDLSKVPLSPLTMHTFTMRRHAYLRMRGEVPVDELNEKEKEVKKQKRYHQGTFKIELVKQMDARWEICQVAIKEYQISIQELDKNLNALKKRAPSSKYAEYLQDCSKQIQELHKAASKKEEVYGQFKEVTSAIRQVTDLRSAEAFWDKYKRFEKNIGALEQRLKVLTSPQNFVHVGPLFDASEQKIQSRITFAGLNKALKTQALFVKEEKVLQNFPRGLAAQLEAVTTEIGQSHEDEDIRQQVEALKEEISKDLETVNKWKIRLTPPDKLDPKVEVFDLSTIKIVEPEELKTFSDVFKRIHDAYQQREKRMAALAQQVKEKNGQQVTEADSLMVIQPLPGKQVAGNVYLPATDVEYTFSARFRPRDDNKFMYFFKKLINSNYKPYKKKTSQIRDAKQPELLSKNEAPFGKTQEITQKLTELNLVNALWGGELPDDIKLRIPKGSMKSVLANNSVLVFDEVKNTVWVLPERRFTVVSRTIDQIKKSLMSGNSMHGFTLPPLDASHTQEETESKVIRPSSRSTGRG